MSYLKKISCWIFTLSICITGLVLSPAHASSTATITGQVTGVDGLPLDGVTVSSHDVVSVTTNPGGFYTLTGIDREDGGVLVTFSKNGYVLTQGVASFKGPLKTGNNDRHKKSNNKKHHSRDERDNEHKKKRRHDEYERYTRLKDATLNRVMLESGATQIVSTSIGGTFTEKGFSVTFTPDSFNALGDIDLVISPIDVSTDDFNAAPGDFSARRSNGLRVTLESFSMADFTLSQNGQPVNLKPGATATIELLLPETTSLVAGDSKPLWYFDMSNGLWIEQGVGVVGASTTTPGRLAVFATVTHFTFWNSDQPLNSTAISGRVVDVSGNPVGGASVEGYGVDYSGHSYAVPTDANGNYCIQVKTGATSSLTARINLSGLVVNSGPLLVTSGATTSSCAAGGAMPVDDIVLGTSISCVSGDVLNDAGLPVVGAVVYVANGSFTNTDANGQFTLLAPANSDVRVASPGYPVVTVSTGSAGEPCAVAAIRPGTGAGGTACITGRVFQCSPDNPYPGVIVEAFDSVLGDLLSSSLATGADGQYCIDNLPANTDVNVSAASGDIFGIGRAASFNTGTGGGSCAVGACIAGPEIDVFCF